MIILKVTKDHCFTLCLDDTFFKKPNEERGVGGIDPPAVVSRLKKCAIF